MKISEYKKALFKLPVEYQQLEYQECNVGFFGEDVMILIHPNKQPMQFTKGIWKPLMVVYLDEPPPPFTPKPAA